MKRIGTTKAQKEIERITGQTIPTGAEIAKMLSGGKKKTSTKKQRKK